MDLTTSTCSGHHRSGWNFDCCLMSARLFAEFLLMVERKCSSLKSKATDTMDLKNWIRPVILDEFRPTELQLTLKLIYNNMFKKIYINIYKLFNKNIHEISTFCSNFVLLSFRWDWCLYYFIFRHIFIFFMLAWVNSIFLPLFFLSSKLKFTKML